jgi:hypothetical protein
VSHGQKPNFYAYRRDVSELRCLGDLVFGNSDGLAGTISPGWPVIDGLEVCGRQPFIVSKSSQSVFVRRQSIACASYTDDTMWKCLELTQRKGRQIKRTESRSEASLYMGQAHMTSAALQARSISIDTVEGD